MALPPVPHPPNRLAANVFHFVNRPSAIIALNTDVIYSPTSSSDAVAPRSDGWWGPHEYAVLPQPYDKTSPYLAWIPALAAYDDPRFEESTGLDPSILRLNFADYPLTPSFTSTQSTTPATSGASRSIPRLPPKPLAPDAGKVEYSLVSPSETMRAVVKQQVFNLISEVKSAIDVASTNRDFASIRMPEEAIFRLQQSYYWNSLPGTVTTAGHFLILASLKRSVLELHGFLLWLKDVDTPSRNPESQKDNSRKAYATRGVIVNDVKNYLTIGRFGIAVYMKVDLSVVVLSPSARAVDLSPIPLRHQLLVPPGSRKGHLTYIYFYPPIVENFEIYELAARGYASRLDQYQPNADIEKLHAQMSKDASELYLILLPDNYSLHLATGVAQGIYFPYVKCPVGHLRQQADEECTGIQPFSPVPPLRIWSLGRQQMEWPPVFKGPGRPPPIISATLPPLLFFRCSKIEKQQAFFFIWCCIRQTWLKALSRAPYGSPERKRFYLTHQEWRSLLSGDRFKKAARNLGVEFDLRHFWRHDPFLWADGSTPKDISPVLGDPNVRLSPEDFLDTPPHSFRLKRLLCYDIAVFHIHFQFEEVDEILMKARNLDIKLLDERRQQRWPLFHRSFSIWNTAPPWESPDPNTQIAWFEIFRGFLCDWPPVYPNRPHCRTSLIQLEGSELQSEIGYILQVYYTGVIKTLNTIPTLMWTYPGTQGLKNFIAV